MGRLYSHNNLKEAKEQFDRGVLLSEGYYNEFIGCKIHSKHIRGLQTMKSVL